jgi:CRP/FNR family transcriptional regulator, cyclic AMP receptor protein
MEDFSTTSRGQGVPCASALGDSTLIRVLRTHAFTQGFSESQVEILAALASRVVFPENEVILVSGERSNSFYLLIAGSVAVELRTVRYSVCVQALGPGHVFGWSALLDRQDTLFQVRARERTSALRLDGAALAAACRADPELGAEMFRRTLRVVAGRVKATEQRFAEMCGVRL